MAEITHKVGWAATESFKTMGNVVANATLGNEAQRNASTTMSFLKEQGQAITSQSKENMAWLDCQTCAIGRVMP